jgi:hypothetical protein
MKAKSLGKKSRTILKAMAEGHSFEQILSRHPKLNYHDIFRAMAEAPSHYWHQSARAAAAGCLECGWAARLVPHSGLRVWQD